MFANPCLGEMSYEGTTAAVVMAGIFLCFLIEYIGMRIVAARTAKDDNHSAFLEDRLPMQALAEKRASRIEVYERTVVQLPAASVRFPYFLHM